MSQPVTLSEQIGAMALIDQLRHQKMQAKELVDLSARRIAVADRIRAYYQGQGTDVSDTLIEQGVRAYFAGRLCMEQPSLPTWKAGLVHAYVRRHQWMPHLGKTVLAFAFLGSLHFSQALWLEQRNAMDLREQAEMHALDKTELAEKVDQLKGRLGEALVQLPASARPLAELTQDDVAAAEHAVAAIGDVPTPPADRFVDDHTHRKYYRDADPAGQAMLFARNQVDQARAKLDALEELLEASKTLEDLERRPGFVEALRRYPPLNEQHQAAQSAVTGASADTTRKAKRQVDSLADKFALLDQLNALQARQDALVKESRQLALYGGESEPIQAILAGAARHLTAMEPQRVAGMHQDARRLLDLADTSLELVVVNRAGERSGVERTHHDSGGRSWYAVVNALDAKGDAVAIPMVSSETGEKRWATTFAVSISEDRYQALREDKTDDGHIDDNVVGKKERGRLTLTVPDAPNNTPRMILEW